MCPSFRVTRKKQDLTRGRTDTLRLAISGQLGPDALTSDQMAETMKLCVSCKGCKHECPTGVDMTRIKIEVLSARARKNTSSLNHRLVAYLPRNAPWAAPCPCWQICAKSFRDVEAARQDKPQAVFFADCFNRYFEPENLRVILSVLDAADVLSILQQPPRASGLYVAVAPLYLRGLWMKPAVRPIGLLMPCCPSQKRACPSSGWDPVAC